MTEYTCNYSTERGRVDDSSKFITTEVGPVDAAHTYAKKFPSDYKTIQVWKGTELLGTYPNIYPGDGKWIETVPADRLKAVQNRLELLQKLYTSVEDNEGDLSRLSYLEINALVENMQDFPGLAESLNPEEYAVREKLYKVAFFDRNLQAGLQAQYAEEQAKEATVQTELLNKLNIAVGNKPSGSAAKGSNVAKNAAMLGGAAALMKLNKISQDVNEISEDASDISEGFGGF